MLGFDGMLALSGATGSGNGAFTIGHYSFGPKNYVADWRDHLFVHEYGHYIQSQRMGLFYFPVVAIPSLASAAFTSKMNGMEHKERWFEVDASYLGAKHFDKKYGSGKARYTPNSPDYFDINIFRSDGGLSSEYINPRLNRQWQDCGFPYSSKVVFWDFLL